MPSDASTRPGAPGTHLGVVGALNHHLGPLVQLEAVHHDDVGPAHLDHEARAYLEVVRVLVPAGERVHFHEVPAHRLGEGLEVGDGGHHPDLVRRARRAREEREPGQGDEDEVEQMPHRSISL